MRNWRAVARNNTPFDRPFFVSFASRPVRDIRTQPVEPSPEVTELITKTTRVAADIRTTSRSIAAAANATAETEVKPGAIVDYYGPASAEAANARSRMQTRHASLLFTYQRVIHSQSERDWRASVPFAPSRAALSMLHSCQLHTPRFNPSPKVLHLIRPV